MVLKQVRKTFDESLGLIPRKQLMRQKINKEMLFAIYL